MDPRTAGMFNQLALTFAAGLLVATAIAVLLPGDLGVLFLPAGLVLIAVSYLAGGGLSIRTPASTPIDLSTTFARVETDIRMYGRNVNWNILYIGLLLGGALIIAGLVAFFV